VIYKNQPSGTIKNGYALSRTVVLPDFQGLGIGKSISEFTAQILLSIGGRVFTKTINPALGEHRNNNIN
jgi:GNAT superfamily N-acetyltransferase